MRLLYPLLPVMIASVAAAQVVITPVALSGDPVPGMPGRTFLEVGGIAQIGPQGNIGFSGVWAGQPSPHIAMFTGQPGAWSMGLRWGDSAPLGPDGIRVTSLAISQETHIVFGAGNRLAAPATLGGSGVNGANDRVILAGDAGAPARVARTSFTSAGAIGPWFDLRERAVMNSSGMYALIGDFSSGGTHRGVAVGGPGQAATVIAQTGDPAPGAPPGSTYTGGFQTPVISDTGAVAFLAPYREPNGLSRAAIFRSDAGAVSLVAATSLPAPTTPGLPEGSLVTALSEPSIGRAGHVAFAGAAGSPAAPALWMSDADGSNLRGVASGGASLPGAPATPLVGFTRPNVGPTGDLAFVGRYLTGGVVTAGTDERLWKHRDGVTSLWLTEGTQAPGQPAGVRINFTFMKFTELNARGQIAFLTPLFGPGVTSDNEWALLVLNSTGELIPIARAGSAFQVAPGDVRTIRGISMATAFTRGGSQFPDGGMGGGARALADDGTLVFQLSFTNNTTGVFVTTITGSECYANCDGSTAPPILNVNDFICFQNLYGAGSTAANCDGSTFPPVLNVNDFICFQTAFAAGCP